MELTPQERECIYLEEKARREKGGGGNAATLALLGIAAAIGLAGVVLVSRSSRERKVSLEDLRKAYSGLDPEEIEEMKYI